MGITTTTHLNFHGTAREALDFYGDVFGGRVHVTTYGDVGMPADQPDAAKVLFGQVEADSGFRLMAYDVPGETGGHDDAPGETRRGHGMTFTDRPFFVSVGGGTLDEVSGSWGALTDGATVVEPLAPSAWSPGFGMLVDRFGVTWTYAVDAPAAA